MDDSGKRDGKADTSGKENYVGRRLDVYWEGDKAWFRGSVTEQQTQSKDSTRRVFILYDDGDEEWIDMDTVKFKWIDDKQEISAGAVRSGEDALRSGVDAEDTKMEEEEQKPSDDKDSKGQLVGRRLAVYWEGDNQWYSGTVVKVTEQGGEASQQSLPRVFVEYDDGDQEWLDLSLQLKVRWIDHFGNEINRETEEDWAAASASVCGRRLEVFWKDDKAWYPGFIHSTLSAQTHLIHYDDGTKEELDLSKEIFRLKSESDPSPSGAASGKAEGKGNKTPPSKSKKKEKVEKDKSETDKDKKKKKLSTSILKEDGELPAKRRRTSEGASGGGGGGEGSAVHGGPKTEEGETCVVGRDIEIYWPLDKAWYPGTVVKETKEPGKRAKCTVLYRDENVEMVDLAKEHFKWKSQPRRGVEASKVPKAGSREGWWVRVADAVGLVCRTGTVVKELPKTKSGEVLLLVKFDTETASQEKVGLSTCRVEWIDGSGEMSRRLRKNNRAGGKANDKEKNKGKEKGKQVSKRKAAGHKGKPHRQEEDEDDEEDEDEKDSSSDSEDDSEAKAEEDRKVEDILACRNVREGQREEDCQEDEEDDEDWWKGKKVSVWWSIDNTWYPAVIESLTQWSGVANLLYLDDNMRETVTLYKEKYIWLSSEGKEDTKEMERYEYLVKWQGLSHLKCEWMCEGALLSLAKMKLHKYHERHGWRVRCSQLDSKWTLPQRVIAEDKSMGQVYVKWTALGYEHCTWEETDEVSKLDPNVISTFQHHHKDALKRTKVEMAVRPRVPAGGLPHLKTQPSKLAGGDLFPHQMEALNWLRTRWHAGMNVILADEMGLGKTVSTITFLHQLIMEFKSSAPSLVVVPLSTLPNWMSELQQWTPHLNALEYHGTQAALQVIRQHEFYAEREGKEGKAAGKKGAGSSAGTKKQARPCKFHVMVTTYEKVLSDWGKLKDMQWECIVVDEGHRLKNNASKLYSTLLALPAAFRMLLTGTPLQNNLAELFNLMTFVERQSFPSLQAFQDSVSELTSTEQIERLKSLVAPHLLRRVKKDVMKSIPPREERVVPVDLTALQQKFYKALLTKNYQVLRGIVPGAATSVFGVGAERAPAASAANLQNIVMQLRKVCNHPFLLDVAEAEAEAQDTHAHDAPSRQTQLANACGKFGLLWKILEALHKQGHRVLLFSQMTRMLDLLEEFVSLTFGADSLERIDGNTPVRLRQAAISRYNKPDSSSFVFLLSTRACGLGINLASADTVIIYDSDWNPHNDIQAINRAHRIGQSKRLLVYRFTTRLTVEERMLTLANKKLLLERLFVQGTSDLKTTVGARKEIADILWWGTEELFAQDDHQEDEKAGEGESSEKIQKSKSQSKIVWDDEKLARLLERSKGEENQNEEKTGTDNEGNEENEDTSGLLGSINMWDLREGSLAVTPLAGDDEDLDKESEGGEGSGRPRDAETADRDWDGLLGARWAAMQAQEQAQLGVGKRSRRVNYAENFMQLDDDTAGDDDQRRRRGRRGQLGEGEDDDDSGVWRPAGEPNAQKIRWREKASQQRGRVEHTRTMQGMADRVNRSALYPSPPPPQDGYLRTEAIAEAVKKVNTTQPAYSMSAATMHRFRQMYEYPNHVVARGLTPSYAPYLYHDKPPATNNPQPGGVNSSTESSKAPATAKPASSDPPGGKMPESQRGGGHDSAGKVPESQRGGGHDSGGKVPESQRGGGDEATAVGSEAASAKDQHPAISNGVMTYPQIQVLSAQVQVFQYMRAENWAHAKHGHLRVERFMKENNMKSKTTNRTSRNEAATDLTCE